MVDQSPRRHRALGPTSILLYKSMIKIINFLRVSTYTLSVDHVDHVDNVVGLQKTYQNALQSKFIQSISDIQSIICIAPIRDPLRGAFPGQPTLL